MRIETIVVSPWQANCHLIAAGTGNEGSECVVVDPGVLGSEVIVAALAERGWSAKAILATHGHLDHVGSAAVLAEVWDVPVYCHAADQEMLARPSAGLGPRLIPLIEQLLGSDSLDLPSDLRDYPQTIDVADLSIRTHHTPGHTPGSVVLEVADGTRTAYLTGDLIFQGTIGRTDLPGGDAEAMRSSLAWVAGLDNMATLVPGHGPSTVVSLELHSNPYLQPDFLKD